MGIVLHAFPPSPRSFKVLLAANLLGLDYTLRPVNLGTGENRTPEFAQLNINQRCPVLVDGDFVLWESNAILEYLALRADNTQFVPSNPCARLQVVKWLYWDAAHWDPAVAVFTFENVVKAFMKIGVPDPQELARGGVLFRRAAGVLDQQLSQREFVAGDTLTAADVALGAPFLHAAQAQLPLDDYAHIRRWQQRLTALPVWRQTAAQALGPAPLAQSA